MKDPLEGPEKRKMLIKELPYPLSVNHYYERGRNGTVYVSQKGKAYKYAVGFTLNGYLQIKGKVKLHVDVYPPDKRKRDLDNINKCLLDSLEESGIIEDDYNIEYFSMKRCDVVPGGKVVINIQPYEPEESKDLTNGFGSTKLNSNVTRIEGKIYATKKGEK